MLKIKKESWRSIVAICCFILGGAGSVFAQTVVQEAENSVLSGGAFMATDHIGYSGGGFVAGFIDSNIGSAASEFSVDLDTDGLYDLEVIYANGTGVTRTLTIYIDGVYTKVMSFGVTSN